MCSCAAHETENSKGSFKAKTPSKYQPELIWTKAYNPTKPKKSQHGRLLKIHPVTPIVQNPGSFMADYARDLWHE